MRILLSAALILWFQTAFANNEMDHPESLTPAEVVEVLWSKHLAQELDPVLFYSQLSFLAPSDLDEADKLRLLQMQNTFQGRTKTSGLYFPRLSQSLALRIAGEGQFYSQLNLRFGAQAIKALKKAKRLLNKAQTFRSKTPEEIQDLVFESPLTGEYNEGEYEEGVKLFLFCRKDRFYPCRFVMKDSFDQLVRNEDQTLWSMPALAKSAGNLPFNITNGQTPSGVHSIDSVMPSPDQQISYGKFRRMILNWIPNDQATRSLLPESAHKKSWWKQASIARDVGRKWLRIHGTGRINKDPDSKYFPHMPTSGCVSVREGEYEDIEYRDQRKILDKIMEQMQLAPVYVNEVEIKGVFYVIELDDKKERVSEETLADYGIN